LVPSGKKKKKKGKNRKKKAKQKRQKKEKKNKAKCPADQARFPVPVVSDSTHCVTHARAHRHRRSGVGLSSWLSLQTLFVLLPLQPW
jgi:hypothetical protein